MRKYTEKEERSILVQGLVREWTRSGLLSVEQRDRMLDELQIDLRRTNGFFRAILFGFGLLITFALTFFIVVALRLNDETVGGVFCLFMAAVSIVAAEFLTTQFRLYRYGVEEAFAMASVFLAAAGVGLFIGSGSSSNTAVLFIATLTIGIGATVVYSRFGYVYSGVVALIAFGGAPFTTEMSDDGKRAAAAATLFALFLLCRWKLRSNDDDYPSKEFAIFQAFAWLGVYAVLNVKLDLFLFYAHTVEPNFYWLTYLLVWVIPVLGLFLAIRHRDKPLLHASMLLALVTLATNKSYLGETHQTWDPILLGMLLIGIALGVRRWLGAGDRNGFTAARILLSDKRGIAAIGTISAALPGMQPHATPAPKQFEPDGGRSGGAGASGSF